MSIVPRKKAGTFTLLIMGLFFSVGGAFMSFFLGSDITFTCQRSTDSCVLESTGWAGEKKEIRRFPLSQVKSAVVESKERTRSGKNNRSKPTYQVLFRTTDGDIPFSNVWTSNHEGRAADATAINRYLASSEESLVVVQSGKIVRLIGYLFFGIGLLMLMGGVRGILKTFLLLGFALQKRR